MKTFFYLFFIVYFSLSCGIESKPIKPIAGKELIDSQNSTIDPLASSEEDSDDKDEDSDNNDEDKEESDELPETQVDSQNPDTEPLTKFGEEPELDSDGNNTDSSEQDVLFLEEGEGDCDNSLECAGNLVCMNPNGKTEEKNSNEHGFSYVVENEIDQPGGETCEAPNENSSTYDDEDIKYAANTLVVKNDDKWYFVYCSGTEVKISRDWDNKQDWEKQGTRNIGISGSTTKLHCPEKGDVKGLASATCECNEQTENYHEKRKDEPAHFEDNVAAPGSITPNQEIYIGPNNNMNSCLKVVKEKSSDTLRIHSPCALEPWKTNQKCNEQGDYDFLLDNYEAPDNSGKNVHELDCSEFRLNN